MTRKTICRSLAVALVLGASGMVTAPVNAAPDCRGATGIIRCTSDRINCVLQATIPPDPSCL